MIALLIGSLGIGGIAAVALKIFGFGAIKTFVTGIPPRVWLIIGAVVLVVGLFFLHQHIVHKALKAADKAGYDRRKVEDDAKLTKAHNEALAWKQKADATYASLAHVIRKLNDEEAANIARRSDDLILRGPGKARCGQGDHSGLPTASSGHQSVSRSAGTAVDSVPDGQGVDLIGLPFTGAVGTAKVCDLNRSEVVSWRSWYDQLAKTWPR